MLTGASANRHGLVYYWSKQLRIVYYYRLKHATISVVVIFGATLHVEETLRKTDKKQNVKLKKYSTIGRQKVRLTKVFPYSLPSVGPRADPFYGTRCTCIVSIDFQLDFWLEISGLGLRLNWMDSTNWLPLRLAVTGMRLRQCYV